MKWLIIIIEELNMEKQITETQEKILEFISSSIEKNGVPPSIKEIGKAVGLSSSSSVHYQLERMEKMGLISRDKTKSRCIAVKGKQKGNLYEYPLLMVDALESEDDDSGGNGHSFKTITLPVDFVGCTDAFIMEMKGDSMTGAGILDGDFCIIKHQTEPVDGDIVLAKVEDELTIKRFFNGSGYFILEPENRRFKSIMVREAVFLGKIIGILRNIEKRERTAGIVDQPS